MALDSVWNGYQRSMSIRHESMKHGKAKLELVTRFVPVSSFLVSTPFAGELKPEDGRGSQPYIGELMPCSLATSPLS